MFVRIAAVLPLFAVIAHSQFFSLATSADASRVYFATSLRQKDTHQPEHGKLFRFDTALALQESRTLVPPSPVPSGIEGAGKFSLSNTFDLKAVSVSSDGNTLAAVGWRYCSGDVLFCRKGMEITYTTITRTREAREFPGDLRLSPNGRWAFGRSSLLLFSSPRRAYLIDVENGRETPVAPDNGSEEVSASDSPRPVANDGTVVYVPVGERHVVVYRDGSYRNLESPRSDSCRPSDAVIDAEARFVVYTLTCGSGILMRSLYIASLADGLSRLLADNAHHASLSDDGTTALFLRDDQLWTTGTTPESVPKQVTSDPAEIQRAILSGDGRTVVALSADGRLLKISTATGSVTTLISQTPWLDPSGYGVPGQPAALTGAGLDPASGAEVTLNNKPVRVLGVQSGALLFLVPPDTPLTTATSAAPVVAVKAHPASPFAGPSAVLTIASGNPEALNNRWGDIRSVLLAVHQDWAGFVTASNPARPGEIVHIYALRLGPTDPVIQFGEAAPTTEPLARLVQGYRCDIDWKLMQVYYQGLAPGLTGIYQLDLEIPPDAAGPEGSIVCQLPYDLSSAFGGRIPLRQDPQTTYNGRASSPDQ